MPAHVIARGVAFIQRKILRKESVYVHCKSGVGCVLCLCAAGVGVGVNIGVWVCGCRYMYTRFLACRDTLHEQSDATYTPTEPPTQHNHIPPLTLTRARARVVSLYCFLSCSFSFTRSLSPCTCRRCAMVLVSYLARHEMHLDIVKANVWARGIHVYVHKMERD